MTPFGLSGLLAGISSFGLGLYVFLKSPSRKLARAWFLFTLSVGMWGFGACVIGLIQNPLRSFLIWKLAYALGVIWIAALFYHFVCAFLELERKRFILTHYAIASVFLVLLPTPLFFSHVRWVFNSFYYAQAGVVYPFFFAWWTGVVIHSHYEIFRSYHRVSPDKKKQIKIFAFATIIGYTGGLLAFLPDFGIDLYPWGHFSVCVYPLIMTYGIMRHHLMDITVIIRRTFFYSLAVLVGFAVYVLCIAHFTHRAMLPWSNFMIMTSALSLGLGLFVLLKGCTTPVKLLWALFCFSVASWSLGVGMMVRSTSFQQALFWQNILLYGTGSVFIPILFLHFASLLVREKIKLQLVAGYICAGGLSMLSIAGRFAFVIPKPPFNYYTAITFSGTYLFYTAYFFATTAYAHWLLYKAVRRAEGQFKNQLKYVLIGTAIGFFGGSTTFLLAYNIHFFPLGAYFVFFYIPATTYAIFKHNLMDIRLVIRKSLVYSLMAAALTIIYLVVITESAHIFQGLLGFSTLSYSIIAASVVTAIFHPLRMRMQTLVDRYFFPEAQWQAAEELARGVAHEIKKPVAAISLPAELTLMDLDDLARGKSSLEELLPEVKRRLKYIMKQVTEASFKIDAIRELTHPHSDGAGEAVELPRVIKKGLANLKALLREAQVEAQVELPGELSPIKGSARQLEIVFENLIKNAAEAMTAISNSELRVSNPNSPPLQLGGPAESPMVGKSEIRNPKLIHIRAWEEDGTVLVSVKDAGPGIAPENLKHVFEPAYTTKGHRGMGMGLHLAQKAVKAHGGSLEVKSEEGQGTEFVVRLPTGR